MYIYIFRWRKLKELIIAVARDSTHSTRSIIFSIEAPVERDNRRTERSTRCESVL